MTRRLRTSGAALALAAGVLSACGHVTKDVHPTGGSPSECLAVASAQHFAADVCEGITPGTSYDVASRACIGMHPQEYDRCIDAIADLVDAGVVARPTANDVIEDGYLLLTWAQAASLDGDAEDVPLSRTFQGCEIRGLVVRCPKQLGAEWDYRYLPTNFPYDG